MLKEVSVDIWLKTLKNVEHSIFDHPTYLETIASLHHTKIKYWIIYKKSKGFIGFATHIKGNAIIVPDRYSYSSFWTSEEVGDYNFFDYLDIAIVELKKSFKNISFRLPPFITDIRAFNLNGFKTEINYTYLNSTAEFNFRKDINEKLSKINNTDFKLNYNVNHENLIQQHLKDLKDYGFTQRKLKFYKIYLEVLLERDLLKSYSLRCKNEEQASSFVLIDEPLARAYNLFLSSSKINKLASSKLYFEMMLDLNKKGIKSFDLYGANMKNIANYKSGFKGDLLCYYTVKYSYRVVLIGEIRKLVKNFVKKII